MPAASNAPWWWRTYGDPWKCPLCGGDRHEQPRHVDSLAYPTAKGEGAVLNVTCYGDAVPPGWEATATGVRPIIRKDAAA